MKTFLPLISIIITIAFILQISVDYLEAKHPVSIAAKKDTTLLQYWQPADNDTVRLPPPTMHLVPSIKRKDTMATQQIEWTAVDNETGYVITFPNDTTKHIRWIGQADTIIDLGPAPKANK